MLARDAIPTGRATSEDARRHVDGRRDMDKRGSSAADAGSQPHTRERSRRRGRGRGTRPTGQPVSKPTGQPLTRRCRANSESTTPAATEALRLSTSEAIGIDRMESQFSRTRRDRPLPSEPTTMTVGPVPS